MTKHWRCLTCWGRVGQHPATNIFVCEHGHVTDHRAYLEWRSTCPRTTGLVIGPSQRGLRVLDLGELAYEAMARERRELFEQWRELRLYATVKLPDVLADQPTVVQAVDALVDEVCALRDRLAFLEARLAGRDRAAS